MILTPICVKFWQKVHSYFSQYTDISWFFYRKFIKLKSRNLSPFSWKKASNDFEAILSRQVALVFAIHNNGVKYLKKKHSYFSAIAIWQDFFINFSFIAIHKLSWINRQNTGGWKYECFFKKIWFHCAITTQ